MATSHNENWKRLGDGSLPTQDPDTGLGHIVPVATYTRVYLALLGLTVLTVAVAGIHFGEALNITFAILIATVKVCLVSLIFMHLRWENRILWIIATYPLIILVLLFLGTLGDASVKERIAPLHIEANKILH